MRALIFLLLITPGAVIADKLKDTATALILADWYTTGQALKQPGIIETNRTLGPHPTQGAINRYFASKLSLHYLLNQTDLAPLWNGWQIYITLPAVHGNIINMRVRF